MFLSVLELLSKSESPGYWIKLRVAIYDLAALAYLLNVIGFRSGDHFEAGVLTLHLVVVHDSPRLGSLQKSNSPTFAVFDVLVSSLLS